MCLPLIGCKATAMQTNFPTELCTECTFICRDNVRNLFTYSTRLDSHQNRSNYKSPCIVPVKNWHTYLKMCKWWLGVCDWIDSDLETGYWLIHERCRVKSTDYVELFIWLLRTVQMEMKTLKSLHSLLPQTLVFRPNSDVVQCITIAFWDISVFIWFQNNWRD